MSRVSAIGPEITAGGSRRVSAISPETPAILTLFHSVPHQPGRALELHSFHELAEILDYWLGPVGSRLPAWAAFSHTVPLDGRRVNSGPFVVVLAVRAGDLEACSERLTRRGVEHLTFWCGQADAPALVVTDRVTDSPETLESERARLLELAGVEPADWPSSTYRLGSLPGSERGPLRS